MPDADSTRRVALVLTQRRDSGNWDPAGFAAASAMTERHGFLLEVVEGVGFERYAEVASGLAADGVDLVIGHASDYAGAMLDVARAHPQTRFAVFSWVPTTDDLPNVAGYTVSWNQVEFLIGVVAGLATRSGIVGSVRGVELLPAEHAIANLVKGIQHVQPDAVLVTEGIADWFDFEGARTATAALVAGGADVIYPAADSADAAVQEACAELGVLTFGEYVDEDHLHPDAIMCSFLVNEGRAYDELGEMLASGDWQPGIRSMDVSTGDITFTRLRNLPEGAQARFDEIYREIAEGALSLT